jgi:hypothetical protein
MLGGGPASQNPQIRSHQIRCALLHTVMPLSSRYPQLLRKLKGFSPAAACDPPHNRRTPRELRRFRVNAMQSSAAFLHRSDTGERRQSLHRFKTKVSDVARR